MAFSGAKCSEASAALAYYTIFSIFPLLLVIVNIGSFFFDETMIEQELILFFTQFFPVSQDFIQSNIQEIFAARGTISIISLVTLVWSSTGVFSTLILNVNSAWPEASPRSFFKLKLVSVGIVLALTLVMIVTSFSFTFKNILISLGIPMDPETIGTFLSSVYAVQVIPIVLKLIVLYLLYFIVPQIKVKKLSALLGAFIATLSWQILTVVFSSYMRIGIQRYEVIYGSLGKIIALLAWTYFSGWIILFGAHLSSSIDRFRDGHENAAA